MPRSPASLPAGLVWFAVPDLRGMRDARCELTLQLTQTETETLEQEAL